MAKGVPTQKSIALNAKKAVYLKKDCLFGTIGKMTPPIRPELSRQLAPQRGENNVMHSCGVAIILNKHCFSEEQAPQNRLKPQVRFTSRQYEQGTMLGE
ncbi:MAG: hypothetical protein ACFB10_08345 [Salibacteraceae bacterium]